MSTENNRCKCDDEMELRRGPWTLEEDTLLIHYITCHGEGLWNLLAKCSGLKRTGKSCRLRWLNYLKPDVKRGNFTLEEQLLILDLHSKLGNRWSRIAQHLPGRTDNEIKNYWRTRVQKQARQLKIDANSMMFRDTVRCLWLSRLMEKMGSSLSTGVNMNPNSDPVGHAFQEAPPLPSQRLLSTNLVWATFDNSSCIYNLPCSENSSPCISSDSMAFSQLPAVPEFPPSPPDGIGNLLQQCSWFPGGHHVNNADGLDGLGLCPATSALGGSGVGSPTTDCSMKANSLVDNIPDSLWSMDELWQVKKLHESEN